MNRTILLLPLLLLPLGCSLCADPLFQTAPLAGDAASLRKFAGEWFDENGNLIAVISTSPEPRLSVQTPKELEPKGARVLNSEIVFRLASDDPSEVSFRLTGENEISVSIANDGPAALKSGDCSCTKARLPVMVLVRNPSPAWHMKLTVRKGTAVATELANAAFEGTMDRLAEAL